MVRGIPTRRHSVIELYECIDGVSALISDQIKLKDGGCGAAASLNLDQDEFKPWFAVDKYLLNQFASELKS